MEMKGPAGYALLILLAYCLNSSKGHGGGGELGYIVKNKNREV
jgi:hypothetical protein